MKKRNKKPKKIKSDKYEINWNEFTKEELIEIAKRYFVITNQINENDED